jgi:hypothetical protein
MGTHLGRLLLRATVGGIFVKHQRLGGGRRAERQALTTPDAARLSGYASFPSPPSRSFGHGPQRLHGLLVDGTGKSDETGCGQCASSIVASGCS